MLLRSLILSSLVAYGAASSYTVTVDTVAGTMTPSALYNVSRSDFITFTHVDKTQNLQVAESSSLAIPCTQAAAGKGIVTFIGGTFDRECTVNQNIIVVYDSTQPLLFYTVGNCQRGMVFSVNLPPSDVLTFAANAKSSTEEVTTDLSYLKLPPKEACNPPRPPPPSDGLSGGVIAGIAVGSVLGFLSVLVAFLWIQRKRRQRATEEASRVMPYSREADQTVRA